MSHEYGGFRTVLARKGFEGIFISGEQPAAASASTKRAGRSRPRLNLGGSAVWFCIAVPVVPIYLLKFGIVELHNNPLIYTLEDGKVKRYRRKFTIDKDLLKIVLKALFVPPASIAVWIGIIVFIVMCFLTAYGFE